MSDHHSLRASRFALVFVAALTCSSIPAAPAGPQRIAANRVAEVTLVSAKRYRDPPGEVEVDAIVTQPDGSRLRVPAFWAGGDRWRFRYSSRQPGQAAWRTECSDATNSGLHGVEGKIEVTACEGDNPLYRHGPIRVAGDHRHFEHADGTPFFWLGDTWWKGLCKRIPWEGFQKLAADRKAKGFTVAQIVAGPYPDEAAFDPRLANEGGMPYEKDYARVNPAYFDYADRRIQQLAEEGIVPAIVGGWGYHMPQIGAAKMKRHWRYLVARYAAYPVVWIIAGEATEPRGPWPEVARYVHTLDPYHRPATFHPNCGKSARASVPDESVIDFDMLQTGHADMGSAPMTIALLSWQRSHTPPMPVVDGEVDYEGHMMSNRQDVQRYMFWVCMMNGAAGHTYGAGGIWQMNSATDRGADYEYTPWFEAMELPGSRQLGLGKKLLEEYPWWRFEPHPEWVEPHGTALLEPHAETPPSNSDKAMEQWRAVGGRGDLPYAAGIPGKVRMVYIPQHFYDWNPPTVKRLEAGADYHAFYFNPVTGRRHDLGILIEAAAGAKLFEDAFQGGDASAWKDCGTPSRRKNGRLVGGKNMWTVVKDVHESDLAASVEADSNAEAGIMLRFHDADNYLLGLYSPSLKAIYLHDRKAGQWGPHLGEVAVPQIGPRIRLRMAARGGYASLAVSDGKRSYCTPTAPVGNVKSGRAGLWHFQVGDAQAFSNFQLSRVQIRPGDDRPRGPLLLTADSPVAPRWQVSPVSLLLSEDYRPPRLPSPQDWVLVLERVSR
jgi:hypothetical protein